MPISALQYSMPNLELEQLKRSALLFQTTYYCSMPTYTAYRPTYKWQPVPDFEMDMPLEFGLSDRGILRHVDDPFPLHGSGDAAREVDREALDLLRPAFEELDRQRKLAVETAGHDDIMRYAGTAITLHREAANDIRSRRVAAYLEHKTGDRVVPVVKSSSVRSATSSARANLLDVVLNELPLPDRDTPWEAIFDWRQDDEAQAQYRRIIAKIGAAAASGVHPSEFRDEMATRLDDYKSAMAIQHSKMRASRLEVLFITTLEIAEDLVRLRFAGAAKKLLSIDQRETSLLENELNTAGREFAYIAAASEQFSSTTTEGTGLDPADWLGGGILY